MSDMTGLGCLHSQIRAASANITVADGATAKRLDSIEASVNELFKATVSASWVGSKPAPTVIWRRTRAVARLHDRSRPLDNR